MEFLCERENSEKFWNRQGLPTPSSKSKCTCYFSCCYCTAKCSKTCHDIGRRNFNLKLQLQLKPRITTKYLTTGCACEKSTPALYLSIINFNQIAQWVVMSLLTLTWVRRHWPHAVPCLALIVIVSGYLTLRTFLQDLFSFSFLFLMDWIKQQFLLGSNQIPLSW